MAEGITPEEAVALEMQQGEKESMGIGATLPGGIHQKAADPIC